MKNWKQVSAGELNAANQRLWGAFGDRADEVVVRINTDPGYLMRLASFATHPGFSDKSTTSLNGQWLRAREIMGRNFFGVEEAMEHFGVNPSKKQLAYLAEIPWSEEVLRACKDTHILIATFALSVLDIRGIVKKLADQTLFEKQNWYDERVFAADKGEIGWQLVRKEPIANSTSKTWNEQQALLSKDEETPNARVIVQMVVGHFLATGERLFVKVYGRCMDLDSDGHRVFVGRAGAKGLSVYYYQDGYQDGYVGVSAARKQ